MFALGGAASDSLRWERCLPRGVFVSQFRSCFVCFRLSYLVLFCFGVLVLVLVLVLVAGVSRL